MKKLKEGQLLYRGCSCDEFARILRVGVDSNDTPVLDIELVDANLNDIMYFRKVNEEIPNNASIVLPKDFKVKIVDVPYTQDEQGIELYVASEELCHRCTGRFYPHDEGVSPFVN